jgi:hypothetical protein
LLLQRLGQLGRALAQLVHEPRILDGDDGLFREIAQKLDLLIGKRLNLLAIDVNRADQLSLLKHGHGDNRSSARNIDETCACVLRQCRGVGNVDHLLRVGDAAKRVFRTRANEWFALSQFNIGGGAS